MVNYVPSEEALVKRAKKLYYSRIGYIERLYPYLWEQSSKDYQDAWKTLAKIELEEELEMEELFNEYVERDNL